MLKKLFVLLFLFGIPFFHVLGQELRASFVEKKLDSLEYLLEIYKTNPAQKANTLLALGDNYIKLDPKKAREYYQEALKIAQKLPQTLLQANILKAIALLNEDQGLYIDALKYCEEGIQLYQNKKNIEFSENEKFEMTAIFNNVQGRVYTWEKNYTEAEKKFKIALELYQKTSNETGISKVLNNFGYLYIYTQEYEKSLDYSFQAMALKDKIGDESLKVTTLNNIGRVYQNTSRYDKALEYSLKSYEIALKLNDPLRIKESSETLSQIHAKLNNYSKAYEYAQVFIAAKDSIAKKEHMEGLMELQIRYDSKEKQKKIEDLTNSKHIHDLELQNQQYLSSFLLALFLLFLVIAWVFYFRNKQKKRDNQLLREKNQMIEAQNEEIEIQREAAINKSRTLVNNEKIFIRLLKNKNVQYGFLDRALRQITESCAVSLKTSRVSIWQYDENQKSIKCLDLYHLNSDRHSRGMELFQSEFPEYFKGIRDDKIIIASDAYVHERTKEFSDSYFKENAIYSLLDVPYYIDARFAGVVCIEHQHHYRGWTQEEVSFVQFISYLITLAFKSKKRRDAEEQLRATQIEIQEKNNELAQQNEEIITQRDLLESQNEEIHDKNQQITAANQELQTFNQNLEDIIRQRTASLMKANEELQQVNQELDMFTYRASHDFKGPISTLQGLANLGFGESKDEFLSSLFEKIKITSTRMDTMLTKLLMVHSVNYKPTQISKINIEEMVEDVQSSLLYFIRRHGVKLQLSVESERFFFSDYELMNMVLQNLLENAIYFRSEHKPEIVIHLKNFENYTELNFRDNGDGIPEEYQNKIFEMFFRASENSIGNGLGLYIVKKALEKLKGTIKVQSKVNDYTVFSINLPKIKKERSSTESDQVLDLNTKAKFPN